MADDPQAGGFSIKSLQKLTCKDGAHLGDEPLGRVEPQDGHRLARLQAELDESLLGFNVQFKFNIQYVKFCKGLSCYVNP